jgi:hypothetical protein
MRLYMFKSEAGDISAFAGDASGGQLPDKFQPWSADGFVESGHQPPHNLSRFKIEGAIKLAGFQLWRTKQKVE